MSVACSVLRGIAALTLLWYALQAGTAADAQPVFFDTGEAPVVQIGIRSGTVVVDAGDRPGVTVDSADDVNVRKVTARFGNEPGAIPMSVPMLSAPVRSPQGDDVLLPPENFVFSTVAPGPHEAILVTATSDTVATVHIPANTALLVVRSGAASQIEVNNYRAGTIIVHARAGQVRLNNDGGDAFVQVVNGQIVANNSNFNRIRARTAVRNIIFEHCSAKQIEATSIAGSILYDGGTLAPGLAHFQSERGNVAIGLMSGARIAARGGQGRVFTAFDVPPTIRESPGEENVIVGGGGPLVNAVSSQGSVYLYDGTIASKRQLNSDWQPLKHSFPGFVKLPATIPLPNNRPPTERSQQTIQGIGSAPPARIVPRTPRPQPPRGPRERI